MRATGAGWQLPPLSLGQNPAAAELATPRSQSTSARSQSNATRLPALPALPKPKQADGSLRNHEVDQGSYDEPLSWDVLKNLSYFNQTTTDFFNL